jgi:cellulose synthase/poly-beta-1,6-N-acetylglucosamine synthase-like glycosyltransferase
VTQPSYTVVIPARNAERTLTRVLEALSAQEPAPLEVIVADDASSDGTRAVAERGGARVVETSDQRFAGGARNAGWDEARGDLVVFLDSDVVPSADWGRGVVRAASEFPGALVGCARTFDAGTRWGWVAHLQVETPFLPRGRPRETSFLSSFCLVVPRLLSLRWDESYGGEDALFSAAAHDSGLRLVFDPRFTAQHAHGRETFADLRRQQRRLAYGLARTIPLAHGVRGLTRRFPVHYFLLLRLPVVYSRLAGDSRLRRHFVSVLPLLAIAEWTLGASALRYALRRPPQHGGRQPQFA